MRNLFLLLFFITLTVAVYGQGMYFRAGLGYGFAAAGQTMDASGTPYNGTYNLATNSYKMKGASFGAGVQGYVGLGYMLTRNAGVQLDMNLGLAPKKYSLSATNVTLPGGVPGDVRIERQAALPIIFSPVIVLQSGGDKWNIYSRTGVAIPLHSEIINDEIRSNAAGTGAHYTDDFTSNITNSLSIGFTGAAGVEYKLNGRMSIWGEVSILSLSVYAKEEKLTEVTRNGQSYPLSSITGTQVVKYSKNVVADSTGANQPTYSQPFSNLAINAGIRLSLSRHTRGSSPGRNTKTSGRPKSSRFK